MIRKNTLLTKGIVVYRRAFFNNACCEEDKDESWGGGENNRIRCRKACSVASRKDESSGDSQNPHVRLFYPNSTYLYIARKGRPIIISISF